MIRKMFNGLVAQKEAQRRAELYRNLIRHEAKLGGELFGPTAPGGRREFFCLDEHTWVWHEEWVDQYGQHQSKTTRYDVRPNGVLKSQDGHYQKLTSDEARNLRSAMIAYRDKIRTELYSFVA
jgi:hypothetical protein